MADTQPPAIQQPTTPPAQQPAAPAQTDPLHDIDFSELEKPEAQPAAGKEAKEQKAEPAKAAERPGAEPPKEKEQAKEEKQPDAKKPEEKPAEQKPAETPPEAPAKTTKRPWELVREKEKELKELQGKHTALEKQLQEAQRKPATPALDPEKEKLQKRLDELESEIRYVNYEKSTEFQEKYLKPYTELSRQLTVEAQELVVEGADGAVRALTAQEFWGVVTAQTLNDAIKSARTIFPDDPTKANQLLNMRKDIKRSWEAMEGAKATYRQQGTEREKQAAEQARQQEARQSQQAQERAERWKQMSEEALKNDKLKDLFQAAEEDAKGKELLTKGFKDADRAFAGGEPLEDGDEPLDEESLLVLHAAVRNKAGAFNYVAYKLRQSNERIAELEKQLSEFQKSEPGDVEKKTDAKTTEIDPTEAALAELERGGV